jgi:copper chaperone CopZ
MKHLLALSLLILPGLLFAEDPALQTYEFPIAGVVCSACANSVKQSIRQVPGVVAVKVRRSKEGELPVLSVTTTHDSISAQELRTALGKDGSHYQIGEPTVKPGTAK